MGLNLLEIASFFKMEKMGEVNVVTLLTIRMEALDNLMRVEEMFNEMILDMENVEDDASRTEIAIVKKRLNEFIGEILLGYIKEGILKHAKIEKVRDCRAVNLVNDIIDLMKELKNVYKNQYNAG